MKAKPSDYHASVTFKFPDGVEFTLPWREGIKLCSKLQKDGWMPVDPKTDPIGVVEKKP